MERMPEEYELGNFSYFDELEEINDMDLDREVKGSDNAKAKGKKIGGKARIIHSDGRVEEVE